MECALAFAQVVIIFFLTLLSLVRELIGALGLGLTYP